MVELIDTDAKIRFSPKILQRLGEELNPSVDQGIIELVKNSYDANARTCDVWLDIETGTRRIIIEDDGDGMDGDSIVAGWLVLGGSSKSTDEVTRLGRRPAGNKGLGRLAALRLGQIARMTSRPGDGYEYTVAIDWRRFEDVKTVDDVPLVVERERSSAPNGTRIELVDVMSSIGRVDVRRLSRALVLLADPFGDEPKGFQPALHSTEYADLAAQVSSRYFDQAEYHLTARVVDGVGSAAVRDWRGETLWEATHEDLSKAQAESSYTLPDAELDLWVFILNAQTFQTRPVQLNTVRDWLGTFGGVHVYVNGLRVAPYGNPGNDWLDMNLARVRSPEERPSTNTSIGRVKVSDQYDSLKQKTDRSGFLDTTAFTELQRFGRDALNWMAQKRVEAAERKRRAARAEAKDKSTSSSESVAASIEKIENEQSKREVQKAFSDYQRVRDQEADVLRREVQLYRTLSTAGITAATFAHESNGNPLKVISATLTGVTARLRRNPAVDYDADYRAAVESMKAATASLNVLSTATLELIDADKRRVGKVRLNRAVQDICSTFEPFLRGRNVELELILADSSEPYVQGAPAAVESVVTNLINNALAAFETSTSETRALRVSVKVVDDVWELEVADSGPGITGIGLDEIWLPGHTIKPHGTGLGLTIVRDAVSDLGGTVAAQAFGELGGATFVVRIPVIGVD